MSLLAWGHPDTHSISSSTSAGNIIPCDGGTGNVPLVADTSFGDVRAWESVQTADDKGRITARSDYSLTAGRFAIARIKVKITAEAQTGAKSILGIDNITDGSTYAVYTLSTADGGADVQIDPTSQQLSVRIVDGLGSSASSTSSLSASGLSVGTVYDLELKWEYVAANQTKATLRVDGTEVASVTHTSASNWTGTVRSAIFGHHDTSKGEGTMTLRFGYAFSLSNGEGSGGWAGWPRDTWSAAGALKVQIIRPDGDSGADGWTGVGDVTDLFNNWDDTTTDSANYNESGTAAGTPTQISTLGSGSWVGTETIHGIFVDAQSLISGALASTAHIVLTLNDGSDDSLTGPPSPNTNSSAGPMISQHNTDSGGNAWVQSDIAGLLVKCGRTTTTTNWRVYMLSVNILYSDVSASLKVRTLLINQSVNRASTY